MTIIDRRPATRAPRRAQRRVHRATRPVERLTIPPSQEPYAPTLGPAPRRENARPSWSHAYVRTLMFGDLAVGALAAAAANVARFMGGVPTEHRLVSVALPFAWVLAVMLGNGYERRYAGQAGAEEYRSVGRGLLYLFAGLSIVSFTSAVQLSRVYIAIALAVTLAGALVVRKVMRHRLVRRRAGGGCLQRTLVIGRSDSAAALVTSMCADDTLGLKPVAVCALDIAGLPLDNGAALEGVPVVGTPFEALEAVDALDIETVAVASHPDLAGASLRRLAWALEERGVDLVVSPGLLDVAGPRMSIRPSTNLSLLHIERPTALRRSVLTKMVIDRVAASIMLILLAPVFAAVALAIYLDDRGPIFYRQKRVGVRGEYFGMVKFRSMRVGADAMVQALQAESDGNGVLFKMKDDPRVTKIGKVLRRYSIDELPQLINVVRGEMSLVGPRPPLPKEVMAYESDALRRLHVLPGMTGLWQVSGRSDLSWEESLRLDLRYVDNWSPVTDMWILLRTVRAVFGHSGAY